MVQMSKQQKGSRQKGQGWSKVGGTPGTSFSQTILFGLFAFLVIVYLIISGFLILENAPTLIMASVYAFASYFSYYIVQKYAPTPLQKMPQGDKVENANAMFYQYKTLRSVIDSILRLYLVAVVILGHTAVLRYVPLPVADTSSVYNAALVVYGLTAAVFCQIVIMAFKREQKHHLK